MSHPQPSPPSRPNPPSPRYVIDFQCPVDFRVVYRLELDDKIIDTLNRLISTLEKFAMPTKQEIVDLINGLTADVTALISTEHSEVLAAIEAGKNTAGEVPQEVADAITTFGNTVKDGVQKILDAAPTPTPTPTPTPPDGGAVPPVPPTDGGTPPAPVPTP